MRIAFITNLYPPIQTGSAYWTQAAAATLAARGHHVIVITCGTRAGRETSELENAVRVYRLPATLRLPKWALFLNFDQFYLMANRRNIHRVREILSDENIEVIQQAGHLLDSTLISSRAKAATGIPVVCSIHTRIGHPTSVVYDRLLRMIDRSILGPALMRRFDRLIALDQVLARHYEAAYSMEHIECVPVCVEDGILEGTPAAPANGPFRIVSVGHVTAMRDRRELLFAVAELKRRGRPVQLSIVGKVLTDVTPRLIEELDLRDTVTLQGELPRETLLALLRSASLEVHWIDLQGIGLAALEAMALGLPVAAWATETIYGDVPLKHLDNIVLIDPRDRTSLIATLDRLAQDPELRGRIGAAARELVRRHLTWHAVAARLERVYGGVVAARAVH
jgi:glycosyltransferase involved in cell wall biosynthesis